MPAKSANSGRFSAFEGLKYEEWGDCGGKGLVEGTLEASVGALYWADENCPF
jgi:hypothetical protein